jgi:hypothetical protein
MHMATSRRLADRGGDLRDLLVAVRARVSGIGDQRRAPADLDRITVRSAVLGRAAHHRRPHEKARLECLGRGAVAVEIAAVIGGEVLNVQFRTSVDIPSVAPLNPAATLRRPFAGIVLAFPVSRVEDLPEPSSSNHGNRPLCLTHAGRIGSLIRNTRMDKR